MPITRTLLAASCAAAVIAIPVSTARGAAPMGFVGTASAEYSSASGYGSEDGVDLWGLNAAGAFGFRGFGIEVDAGWHDLSGGGAQPCLYAYGCPLVDRWNIGGSVFWGPTWGRIGTTITYGALTAEGDFDANATTYGGFAELYAGNAFTAAIKGGSLSWEINSGGGVNPKLDDTGAYVGGVLTGYVTPNLAIQGGIDYVSNAFQNDTIRYSIGAEFLFLPVVVPLSIFGEYSYLDVDGAINDGNVNMWLIGIRAYTGGGMLVDHHRNGTLGKLGAPFDVVRNSGF